jgi:hypothetical protein
MNAAQEFVVVKAQLNRAYEEWSRIEDLPRFITSLRRVRRIDDTHFSYVWHPNGEDKQGIFQIVLQFLAAESRGAPCQTASRRAWSPSSLVWNRKPK